MKKCSRLSSREKGFKRKAVHKRGNCGLVENLAYTHPLEGIYFPNFKIAPPKIHDFVLSNED